MTGLIPPRDDVELMDGYHSPQLDVPVRLNTNESPYPPPDSFVAELKDALDSVSWNRYPDRSATELRSALAADRGCTIDSVFAANGSNEVLQSLCLAYGGTGRSVMTFEPTYALHGHIARVTGASVAVSERGDDFALDVDRAVGAIVAEQPSVVFLCSPDNPTGRTEGPDAVTAVADACAAAGALLVIDEAYGQFAPWSAAELVAEDRALVVTQTFSKTWALAGGRIGYCLAPAWVVAQLEKVVLPYHLDAVTQAAGVLALRHGAEMRERVGRLVDGRAWLADRLAGLPVTQWPSGANFILFRPDQASGEAVWQGLVDRGVLVRNCSSWPRLDGCLRVTVGTDDENATFIDSLSDTLLEVTT